MLIATVTQQRSGSKFLSSVLRKQFGLVVLGEAFNPDSLDSFSYRQFVLSRGLERVFREGTECTLNNYFDGFSTLGGIQQLDLMFNQIDWPLMGWNPFSHEFLYGYLRLRNAVVLSLVRNPVDIFLSEKTLQLSGVPHVFDQKSKSACDLVAEKLRGARIRLDLAEYAGFVESLTIRRKRLREAFSGYEWFAEFTYEWLASAVSIDASTTDLIRGAAALHAIPQHVDGGLASIVAPVRVQPEYDRLFANIVDLQRLHNDLSV